MRGCISAPERGLGAEVWCSLLPYDCGQDIHYSFSTLLTKSWAAFQYSPHAILQPTLSDQGAVLYGFHSPPLLSSHPNPLTSALVEGPDDVFSRRGWLGVRGRGKTQKLLCLLVLKFLKIFLKIFFIFNCTINASQMLYSFCHTTMRISQRYTYVPSL